MLAARITSLHFAISATTRFLMSAGDTGVGTLPSSARRSLILGSARTALISWKRCAPAGSEKFARARCAARPQAPPRPRPCGEVDGGEVSRQPLALPRKTPRRRQRYRPVTLMGVRPHPADSLRPETIPIRMPREGLRFPLLSGRTMLRPLSSGTDALPGLWGGRPNRRAASIPRGRRRQPKT